MAHNEEYIDDEFEIDLFKLINACWKKVWLILLIAAVMGSAMFIRSKSSYVPTYTAKATLYASYNNTQDLSIGENAGSISQTSLSESRSLINTCTAVLGTRMTLAEVIEFADLDMNYSQLSSKISIAAINNSELFAISVTDTNPERAALIANTVANVLPKHVAMVNSNSTVATIDTALTPEAPSSIDNSTKKAFVGAVLGVALVCGVIVVKELYIDWKSSAGEKARKSKRQN